MVYRIEFPHNTGIMVKVDGTEAFVAAKLSESVGIRSMTGVLYNSKQFMSIIKLENGTTTAYVPNLTEVLVK